MGANRTRTPLPSLPQSPRPLSGAERDLSNPPVRVVQQFFPPVFFFGPALLLFSCFMLVVFAHIAEKPSANRVQAAIPSRFDGTNLISFELRSPASMPTPSPHPALLYSFQFISSPARSRSFAFFSPVRTFSLQFALSQLNTLYCFILLPFLSFVLTTSKKKKLFNCLCELVRLCVHMFFFYFTLIVENFARLIAPGVFPAAVHAA